MHSGKKEQTMPVTRKIPVALSKSMICAIAFAALTLLWVPDRTMAQDTATDSTQAPDPTVLVMLQFTFPVERGNEAIASGEWDRVMDQVFDILNPQSAYFYLQDGQRAGMFVYELVESEELTRVNEMLFQALDASVEQQIVMDALQLRQGLSD